jgi:hypothetical protein
VGFGSVWKDKSFGIQLAVTKKLYENIKCDCGHTAKTHFRNQGCCDDCGCTWYHPNVRWVKKNLSKLGVKADTKWVWSSQLFPDSSVGRAKINFFLLIVIYIFIYINNMELINVKIIQSSYRVEKTN